MFFIRDDPENGLCVQLQFEIVCPAELVRQIHDAPVRNLMLAKPL
jgi:hypothetical protein